MWEIQNEFFWGTSGGEKMGSFTALNLWEIQNQLLGRGASGTEKLGSFTAKKLWEIQNQSFLRADYWGTTWGASKNEICVPFRTNFWGGGLLEAKICGVSQYKICGRFSFVFLGGASGTEKLGSFTGKNCVKFTT